MYNFEVKVKVKSMFDVTYQIVINDFDHGEGSYTSKVTKTEQFADWNDVHIFAQKYPDVEILQVVEVHDLTQKLKNALSIQGKD